MLTAEDAGKDLLDELAKRRGERAKLQGFPLRAAFSYLTRLWSDCRGCFGAGGPFLFGRFSIADAMFAPVVFRFRTYAVGLDPECQAYCDHMTGLPAMQRWLADAQREPEVVPAFEPRVPPATRGGCGGAARA